MPSGRLRNLGARWRQTVLIAKTYGLRTAASKIQRRLLPGANSEQRAYERWIAATEPDASGLAAQREAARNLPATPRISVVMPVFNPPAAMLAAAIESVLAQTYEHWELCVVEAGSDDPRVREVLAEYARRDSRIRVEIVQQNRGISANTNVGIRMAQGAFIALLDHDDLLSTAALYEVVRALCADPTLDFLYSDMDNLSTDGRRRFNPLFKPDWSPELALAVNYLTHLTVIRTSLVREIGGFDPATDGAQDWDLFLKVVEQTSRVHHIPKVLYHWRQHAASVAAGVSAKPYAVAAQRRCVDRHLQSRGIPATTEQDPLGYLRLKWTTQPVRAAVVVNSRGDLRALERCLQSVEECWDTGRNQGPPHPGPLPEGEGVTSLASKTSVIMVVCAAVQTETANELRRLVGHFGASLVLVPAGLTSSGVRNYAARQIDAESLVFIDEQLELLGQDSLAELIHWTQVREIGAVGPQIRSRRGRIASAGLVLGLNGIACDLFRGALPGYSGIFGSSEAYRNASAVSGACFAVRREVFHELGGFDATLDAGPGAIDLCLRLREQGARIVYSSHAQAKWQRDAPIATSASDAQTLRTRWAGKVAEPDRYFNPNLLLTKSLPAIKCPGL